MTDAPTFGRYAEIPVDKMTPAQQEAYRFLVSAVGRPLAQAPEASELALRQAERAIVETAAHHAHVRLRPIVGSAPIPVGPHM